jgi:hypothetical protein
MNQITEIKQWKIDRDKEVARKLFSNFVENTFNKKDPYQKLDRKALVSFRDCLIELYPYRKEIKSHPLRCQDSPEITLGSKLGKKITADYGYLFFNSKRDQLLYKAFPKEQLHFTHIITEKDWLNYKEKLRNDQENI